MPLILLLDGLCNKTKSISFQLKEKKLFLSGRPPYPTVDLHNYTLSLARDFGERRTTARGLTVDLLETEAKAINDILNFEYMFIEIILNDHLFNQTPYINSLHYAINFTLLHCV